jgi:mRNA interferase RelE/StbE
LAWEIKFKESARKIFDRLDRSVQKQLLKFLNKKIAPLENPRVFGRPLSYDKLGLWRYRIADYRIMCQIDDEAISILIVKVGHRKDIYNE